MNATPQDPLTPITIFNGPGTSTGPGIIQGVMAHGRQRNRLVNEFPKKGTQTIHVLRTNEQGRMCPRVGDLYKVSQ